MASGEGRGIPESMGNEPRLFGPLRDAPSCGDVGVLSRTAPAVLGLDSDSAAWDGVGSRGARDSSFSMMGVFDAERTDEMLPDREWPGLTVTVLEVSLETRESGRGMNSSVSEKPTLALLNDFLSVGAAASLGKL